MPLVPLGAAILALSSCSSGTTPTPSGSGSLSASVAAAAPVKYDGPVVSSPIATQTPVRTTVPTPGATRPAQNEIGEAVRLDADGSLACAHVEFAFRAPETGQDAAKDLAALRPLGAKTKVAALRAAVSSLPERPSSGQLESLLKVCADLGYQL